MYCDMKFYLHVFSTCKSNLFTLNRLGFATFGLEYAYTSLVKQLCAMVSTVSESLEVCVSK